MNNRIIVINHSNFEHTDHTFKSRVIHLIVLAAKLVSLARHIDKPRERERVVECVTACFMF